MNQQSNRQHQQQSRHSSVGSKLFEGLARRKQANGSDGGSDGNTIPTSSSSELLSMIKSGVGASNGNDRDHSAAPTNSHANGSHDKSSSKNISHTASNEAVFVDDWLMTGLGKRIEMANSNNANNLILGIDSEALLQSLLHSLQPLIGNKDKTAHAPPIALIKAFTSPWHTPSTNTNALATHHLPACYQAHTPPTPSLARAQALGEESLFWAFYGSGGGEWQETAAKELTLGRGWRWHLGRQCWMMLNAVARDEDDARDGSDGGDGPIALTMDMLSLDNPKNKQEKDQQETSKTKTVQIFNVQTWSKQTIDIPIAELKQECFETRFLQHTDS